MYVVVLFGLVVGCGYKSVLGDRGGGGGGGGGGLGMFALEGFEVVDMMDNHL